MKIALISQGPSRVLYPGRDGYDVVMGVNEMPFQYECDWWVLADTHAYTRWAVRERLGDPRLFVKKGTVEAATITREAGEGVKQLWLTHDGPRAVFQEDIVLPPMPADMPQFAGGGPRWNKFGGVTALGLCWHLGGVGSEVDAYGCDMAIAPDWQRPPGSPPGFAEAVHRRFEFERSIWDGLVSGFAKAGMTVNRILL